MCFFHSFLNIMRVLGIESSCDETGVAIYCSTQGLLSHALYSQISLHRQFGGVVPELASRDHIKHLIPLINQTLKSANLQKKDIDAIAYTAGPGLIGALLVGASFAKSLAFGLQVPALAVHHLEAHLLAAQLDMPTLAFPFLALLVSGGHTQLIEAKGLGDYRLLGDTLDDAVGEAFDKTAKLMGIPYPGGARLAQLADAYDAAPNGVALSPFPRPLTDRPGLDFSFSGLKTHALHAWEKSAQDQGAKEAVAKAFQDAVVDTLAIKCARALQITGQRALVVAGGVGANQALRQRLQQVAAQQEGQVYFPTPAFCTDNGAMIAYAGCLHLLQKEQDTHWGIEVKARWPLYSGPALK